jgi:uncharacterized membrane protein
MNNKHTISELIEYFKQEEGIVINEKAVNEEFQQDHADQSSIAIKILSVFGGFFATLTFLGFLLLAGLYDSESGMLLLGFLFIAGSLLVNKTIQRTITDASSICAYLTGHGLLAFALFEWESSGSMVCMLFICIALVTLFITQTYVLSFIAASTVLMSLLCMIFIEEIYNVIHAYVIVLTVVVTYVFLNEATIITQLRKFSKSYTPICMALIVALIGSLSTISYGYDAGVPIEYVSVSSCVTISGVVFILSRILKIYEIENTNSKIAAYIAIGFMLLPTLFASAISGALLILLLCFLVNNKTGLAAGIISFIYFISQYYYDLHFTLLVKSIVLFSTGIVCLLIYIFIIKKIESDESI